MEDHEHYLETCEAAARAGAAELLAWRDRFQFQEKAPADLVTDADLASQAAIRSLILQRHPDHLFVGEEQSDPTIRPDDCHCAWYVDPLDGTTNYVHGYPCYSVSVAVARGRQIMAGVIYDPLADESFTAVRDRGAWCNGVPLRTSDATLIDQALVAVSLPPHVGHESPDLTDLVTAAQLAQAVRRSGSAALNLAYLASGRVDAFWATHINSWDVAAGVLLAQEAGGEVTGRDAAEFDLWNPHLLAAATAPLHSALLNALSSPAK